MRLTFESFLLITSTGCLSIDHDYLLCGFHDYCSFCLTLLYIKQLNSADPLLISRSPGFATGLAQAQIHGPILVGSFNLPPPMKLEALVRPCELMDRQLAFKRLFHPPSWSAQSDDTLVVFGSNYPDPCAGLV